MFKKTKALEHYTNGFEDLQVTCIHNIKIIPVNGTERLSFSSEDFVPTKLAQQFNF